MSSELLLEIRTDPLPPHDVEAAVQRLKNLMVAALRAVEMGPKQSATGFSARRLLVLFRGIPEAPDMQGRITQAVTAGVEELEWPQTMTWRDGPGWASPVRGVLLVFNGEPLTATILGVESGNVTLGPESAGNPRIPVQGADAYGKALAQHGVEIRFPERRRQLSARLQDASREAGAELLQDARLLKSRAIACETPGVVTVPVSEALEKLPRELVQECLRDRLDAFCAVDQHDVVRAAICVTDRVDDPDGATARSLGWAVETYLDDVRCFLERDRRLPLAERCREQREQTVAPELGTQGERSRRLEILCDRLCDELDWQAERDRAGEAIGLLAADARTELLRAFPGLEGVIGGLLAREEGYPASVWQAIADSRRSAQDSKSLPRGRVGKLVALSDRLDRFASTFVETRLDRDRNRSLALRTQRQELAQQMARICIGGSMGIDIRLVGAGALRLRAEDAGRGDGRGKSVEQLALDLDVANRIFDAGLSDVFEELGFSESEVAAVLSADGSSLVSEQHQRLEGLRSLRGDERLPVVAQNAVRIAGILQGSQEQPFDVGLLGEGCERDLYFVYRRLSQQISVDVAGGSFADWLQRMFELNEQVERFLREVLVRDENARLRQNRLALLQRVYWLYAGEIRLSELLETRNGAQPR